MSVLYEVVGAVWGIKLAGLAGTVTLNVLGIEAVANTTLLFTIIVQTP
jgi:hypothetical protein